MNSFEIDEVAVLHSLIHHRQFNGMEVIIEGAPYLGFYSIYLPGFESWTSAHGRNLRKKRPPKSDDAAARQAMLDCIERAKMPQTVPA